MGTLASRKKEKMLQLESNLLISDIPIYVSCKFEMFTFEMAFGYFKNIIYVSFCTGCPTMSFVILHSDGIIAKTL